MRLFAALVPPELVLADLLDASASVRRGLPDARWPTAERIHLTLAFYGEVDDGLVGSLRDRLRRAARRHPPLSLSLAGAGAFGSRARARVLWVGVTGDRAPLLRLAGSAVAAGHRLGLCAEERRYRPHLTLARMRRPTDVRSAVEELATYAGPGWVADRLELVRSRLGPRPTYETVASWPLGGLPAPAAP